MNKKENEVQINIDTYVGDIKGFGPKKAEVLKSLGISTLEDSLLYYPRSYQDLRVIKDSCDCKNDEQVLLKGRILMSKRGYGKGKKGTLHLLAEDDTGRFEAVFFNSAYMQGLFRIGEEFTFFGKVKVKNGRVTIFHPVFSKYDGSEQGIVPVYPLKKGISQKDLRRLTALAKEHADELDESLPETVIEDMRLCSNAQALSTIHYPEDETKYKEARYRLIFEELFDLKTALALSKSRGGGKAKGIRICSGKAEEFIKTLPYSLTKAQKRALDEVLSDMRSDKAMNRLIQGDVGSGKTAVAMAALAEAVFAGFQGIFMAPTDILARQHYETLRSAFSPLGIKVVLLAASLSAKEKREALSMISSGEAQIITGTHSLISESVVYKNAGLVITDEQHRFGVSQRKTLSEKGSDPDILVMTATPIPRTLAMVFYADLDISVIDELPPGRKPIKTLSYSESSRKDAYKLLFGEIEKGRQAYIVAPFIEDSESIDGRSAVRLYEAFTKKHPEISCALLHGDMSQDEKDEIMKEFHAGSISVLICTVVIEVGIDVPNASVMLIENAERFGLSQMHQLRGRVGRGQYDSYCLICTGEESELSKERVETLCSTGDGFVIAEKDLEIRGPGDFFGFRQHGLPQLVLADPVKHAVIAEKAGTEAAKILADDPSLEKDENTLLRESIKKRYINLDNLTL